MSAGANSKCATTPSSASAAGILINSILPSDVLKGNLHETTLSPALILSLPTARRCKEDGRQPTLLSVTKQQPLRPSCNPGSETLWSRSFLLPPHRPDALLHLPWKNPDRNLRAPGASGPVAAPPTPQRPSRPTPLSQIRTRFCAVLALFSIYPSPARRLSAQHGCRIRSGFSCRPSHPTTPRPN